MKLPTYEQQNEFLSKYIAPLFEFNLAKVLRNYRMSKAGPFTDERMQQIKRDVLADIREKGSLQVIPALLRVTYDKPNLEESLRAPQHDVMIGERPEKIYNAFIKDPTLTQAQHKR